MLALTCKYVAKIAMQAESKLKPYKTWESALAFLPPAHQKTCCPETIDGACVRGVGCGAVLLPHTLAAKHAAT